MNKWLYLPLLVSAVACTDSGESRFDEAASSVEGIYSVSSYARNETSCSPDGGANVLGSDKFAVALEQTFFGQKVLTFTSCASAADCRVKLADIRAGEGYTLEFQFTVSAVNSQDLLTGTGVSTGFGMNGTCKLGEVTATTMELTGTRLRIQQSITIADDYPADDGFCTTELARKHAEGNSCSQMEVLTAELLEVL